jgi:hypothetical protein
MVSYEDLNPIFCLEPYSHGWSIFVDYEKEHAFLRVYNSPAFQESSIQFVLIKNRIRLIPDSQHFYRVPVHLGLNAVEIFVFVDGKMTRETYCLFISKM